MTAADCLAAIGAGHGEWLKAGGWDGIGEPLLAAALFALALAIVLAPLFQAAYSRRMQRFMGMHEVDDAPVRWWRPGGRPRATPAADAAAGDTSLADAAAQRERRIARASWAAYAAFVVVGTVVGPLQVDPSLGNMVVVTGYMALMALGPAVVNVRPHGRSWLLWLPPLLVAVMAYLSPGEEMDSADLLAAAAVMSMLNLASVHRTLRAVVGPLLLLFGAGLAGLVLAVWLAIPIDRCWAAPRGLSAATSTQLLTVAIGATVVVLSVWLALAALGALARLIERGWLSDLSLVSACGFAIIAALLAMAGEAPGWSTSRVAFFYTVWLGATFAAYAIALRLQPCPGRSRTLLVLRVFSRDGRTERMLDALQSRWRYAGAVLEIGGPDLAKLNLDLPEFITFLTLRQHELLTPLGVSPQAFADSLDTTMDREGRFRIDEVFCFDSSWKTMVERLMNASDAILLDLRGFDAQRGGTTHEVVRLAALGMMPRVVTVHDAQTDWRHFDATVADGGTVPAPAAKIDANDRDALERCLAALIGVADGRAPAQSRTGSPLAALA